MISKANGKWSKWKEKQFGSKTKKNTPQEERV